MGAAGRGFARDGLSNPEIGAWLFLNPRTVEFAALSQARYDVLAERFGVVVPTVNLMSVTSAKGAMNTVISGGGAGVRALPGLTPVAAASAAGGQPGLGIS